MAKGKKQEWRLVELAGVKAMTDQPLALIKRKGNLGLEVVDADGLVHVMRITQVSGVRSLGDDLVRAKKQGREEAAAKAKVRPKVKSEAKRPR